MPKETKLEKSLRLTLESLKMKECSAETILNNLKNFMHGIMRFTYLVVNYFRIISITTKISLLASNLPLRNVT